MNIEFNAQTEGEFQNLMPISGTVDTFFGGFELDHSFPTHAAAERIYDLLDHQRAAQLYLWGIPLVGMTRWHLGNAQTYTGYDYNTLLFVKTFNERRPILAFGNSDGDGQMLQWTAAGVGVRFMGLVHHTDAEREWAYDRDSLVGRLDKALDEALEKGWTVVDMAREWRVVYPGDALS